MVVGGGAAGVYGAIRAKTLAPNLNVVVIEKGKPLSKVSLFSQVFFFFLHGKNQRLLSQVGLLSICYWQVKISGGGRCNVTNGHCVDNKVVNTWG